MLFSAAERATETDGLPRGCALNQDCEQRTGVVAQGQGRPGQHVRGDGDVWRRRICQSNRVDGVTGMIRYLERDVEFLRLARNAESTDGLRLRATSDLIGEVPAESCSCTTSHCAQVGTSVTVVKENSAAVARKVEIPGYGIKGNPV